MQAPISDHTGKWRSPWPCVLFQEVIPPHQRLASLQEGLRNTQGTEAKEIRRSTNSVFYLGDEKEKERRRKKRQKDNCKQIQAGV